MSHARTLAVSLVVAAALGCAGSTGKPAPADPKDAPRMMSSVNPQKPDCARPGGKLPGDVKAQLVQVAAGFTDPIDVSSAKDGTGRLFVCERPGVIRIIKDGKVLDEPFYDNRDNVAWQFLECGLYGVEFHPKFKDNGLLYISYADMWFNGATMIVEYRVSRGDPNKVDKDSARPIMRIDFPYCNHHGGKVKFGPDGYLYVGVGDGGWEGDVLDVGPDLSTWMGKMLRIDVSDRSVPYKVPATNPFNGAADPKLMVLFGKSELDFSKIKQKSKPEIWAYGIRNPWTFSFDQKTGDLYIADIGQNIWEEIDFQPASSKGGENYGWNWMCGVHPFPIEKEEKGEYWPVVGTLPIAEYAHKTDGICVIGMGVYRGSECPSLDGVYFAGDWGTGRFWGLKRDGAGKWHMQEMLNTSLNFSSGGEDEKGNVYVTSMTSQYGPFMPEIKPGAVWKIVSADKVPAGAKTAPLDSK